MMDALGGVIYPREAMDRLLRAFELIDLNAPPPVNDDDLAILVADQVLLETWNRFAELNVLPRGLQLNQLVWDDGRVWVVEFPCRLGMKVPLDVFKLRLLWPLVSLLRVLDERTSLDQMV